jgi:hypothetical protein
MGHRSRRQNEAATVTVAAKFFGSTGRQREGDRLIVARHLYVRASVPIPGRCDLTIARHSAAQ